MINAVFSRNPKHSPILATMKKTNPIPAKTSTETLAFFPLVLWINCPHYGQAQAILWQLSKHLQWANMSLSSTARQQRSGFYSQQAEGLQTVSWADTALLLSQLQMWPLGRGQCGGTREHVPRWPVWMKRRGCQVWDYNFSSDPINMHFLLANQHA